jgi:hypothetical protein
LEDLYKGHGPEHLPDRVRGLCVSAQRSYLRPAESKSIDHIDKKGLFVALVEACQPLVVCVVAAVLPASPPLPVRSVVAVEFEGSGSEATGALLRQWFPSAEIVSLKSATLRGFLSLPGPPLSSVSTDVSDDDVTALIAHVPTLTSVRLHSFINCAAL